MKKRTIIIGDVHGCLNELNSLLKKISYTKLKDRLIFVGDVIHKGPYSYEVLKKIKSLDADIVMGNHELSFLKFLKGKGPAYPGYKDLKIKLLSNQNQWRLWFESIPFYLEMPDFIVVHAGLHPEHELKNTNSKILTSIRTWDGIGAQLNSVNNPAWFDLYKKKKLVIFGHWAQLGLMIRSNVICLDSGCVYGNQLTALILPEFEIVQVNAEQQYQKISS